MYIPIEYIRMYMLYIYVHSEDSVLTTGWVPELTLAELFEELFQELLPAMRE